LVNAESEIYEGPEVTYNLNENNSYSDVITLTGAYGITKVQCVLSGNTGGIKRLYSIYIRWSGNNKVQSISASNLKISNTSTIHPSAFFSRGFFISGLSSNSGYRQIGTCYIPSDVNVVRVKSTGLKAFFYNRDFWIRMGELNGTISL
jgi:hypothetical protein